MTDFQFIDATFRKDGSESSYDVRVIVDSSVTGKAIEKIVKLGFLLGFHSYKLRVTCIEDFRFIAEHILYKPRFAFHDTPGRVYCSLSPTLNYFMSNFQKSLKK